MNDPEDAHYWGNLGRMLGRAHQVSLAFEQARPKNVFLGKELFSRLEMGAHIIVSTSLKTEVTNFNSKRAITKI